MCVCVCYLVYFRRTLRQDGADSRRKAQLHQALQVSLGIRFHLVSCLLQRTAVYQGETPAQVHNDESYAPVSDENVSVITPSGASDAFQSELGTFRC